MASLVNPSNINGNFPIAGQDNDSQGFRDNFTNIRNNFTFIKAEVEDLQAKAVFKSALIGSTLDNNFLGSQLKNTQFKNYSETLYDWGNTSGEIQLDLALANVHKVYTDGSISINSVIKNWPASLQYSRLLLYITISNTAHTLAIPNNITTSLEGLPGLRVIGSNYLVSYPEAGTFVYEFASVDSGTTVFVRELTRGNQLFRDPNFYFTDIGAGAAGGAHPSGFENVTLKINYGNVLSISANIDNAKDNTDALSVKGAISTYLGLNASEGSNNTGLLKSAGFTVARSRADTPPAGTAVTINSASRVQDGDLIGYYNAMGVTQAIVGSTNPFLQLGAIQFYAKGSLDSIGGNIVISTKVDGGALTPAMIIDNAQGVTIKGSLTIDGTTTTINSTVLTIDDKNIIVAAGAASKTAANGASISVDTAFANIEYHAPDTTVASSLGGDRWISNKAFTVANSQASTSSTTGALVVTGGLGIGGDLNVGGTLGLTSSTNSTSKDTGAFVLANGGLGVELNIVAGGMVSANSTNESTTTTNGALVSQGGLGVAGKALIGGNLFVTSTTESTSDTVGAIITAGGVGIAKRLNVAGNAVVYSGTNSTYTMGSSGSSYTGALIVAGGTHVTKTLMVGNDAGDGKIVINVPVSALAGTVGDFATGALLVGSSGYAGGVSVTGNFNLGQDASGVLYIANKNSSRGTVIDATPTPYVPFQTGGQPVYGAATMLGGINVFGNVYVGQPDTGVGSPRLVNSGNLYVQSGALSTSATTGAIVIQKVSMPAGTSADGFSRGGLGMEGNLYAVGNVILGGAGAGDTNSNVVIDATTIGVNTTRAALVVRGGTGIAGITTIGGNVVGTSSTAGRLNVAASNAKEGALVLTNGGMYVTGTSVIAGNVVLTSGGSSTDTVTGALVITSTGGLGVGGAGNFGGDVSIAGATAGGNGTGALRVTTGGASIAGNLFVQGAVQPINAVGQSGVVVVSATAANVAITAGTATDITNLNFTAEANKTYLFEALIFHHAQHNNAVSATLTKGFTVTFGAGTCNYTVEQNNAFGGNLAITTTTGAGALISATSAAMVSATTASLAQNTAIVNMVTKITGTFYHTAATNVKLQAQIAGSAGTNTLNIAGHSFLKWTKLN